MEYEHIHMATKERLAEMLDLHNNYRRGLPPFDEPGSKPPFNPTELGVLLDEISARLKVPHKTPFNHEAFEL